MTWIHWVAVIIVAGLTAWDTSVGLLFLLMGFFIANRGFAHLQMNIAGLPLYVTETFLLVVLLKGAFFLPNQQRASQGRLSPDLPARGWWWLFIFIGVVSLLRGLAEFPLPDVLRDSAIVYYLAVTIIVSSLPITTERLRLAFLFLFSTAVLKSFHEIVTPYFNQKFSVNLYTPIHQAAGASLPLAYTLLTSFVFQALGSKATSKSLVLLCQLLLVTAIFALTCRSAWVGLALGSLVMFVSLKISGLSTRILCRSFARLSVLTVSGLILSIGLPKWLGFRDYGVVEKLNSSVKGWGTSNLLTRIWLWEDAVSELFSVGLFSQRLTQEDLKSYYLPPDAIRGNELVIPVRAKGRQGQMVKFVLSDVPTTEGAPPVRSSVPPRVVSRLSTGSPPPATKSPPSLPSFPTLFGFLRRTPTSGWPPPETTSRISASPPIATDPPSRVAPVFTPPPLNVAPLKPKEAKFQGLPNSLRRILQPLIGIPFGKPFYPPQIVHHLGETTRYDPHNSYVAILYRLGCLGLVAFLGILVGVYRRYLHLLKSETLNQEGKRYVVAILSCLATLLGHSLSDVTFENSFKGMFLWIFIGLLMNLERMYRAPVTRTSGEVHASAVGA